MDYGNLLRRAWKVIWKFKFLILLGVLVVIGSAGGGSNVNPAIPGFLLFLLALAGAVGYLGLARLNVGRGRREHSPRGQRGHLVR